MVLLNNVKHTEVENHLHRNITFYYKLGSFDCKYYLVRKLKCDVLKAVKMSILVFQTVRSCGLVRRYRYFGGTYRNGAIAVNVIRFDVNSFHLLGFR
jgi:hypothetical protein